MGLKSRRKGKVGELEAVHYLHSLGYPTAQRGQQRSGLETADVVCDALAHVHIEVKYGYPTSFVVGCVEWRDACQQAKNDSRNRGWCVLWRNKGSRIWRLSCQGFEPYAPITVAGDDAILSCLKWLNWKWGPRVNGETYSGGGCTDADL